MLDVYVARLKVIPCQKTLHINYRIRFSLSFSSSFVYTQCIQFEDLTISSVTLLLIAETQNSKIFLFFFYVTALLHHLIIYLVHLIQSENDLFPIGAEKLF